MTRRLERAAALLRNTDRSVAEICLDVGLVGLGSFTTSFGVHFGKPPTEYRASYPPAAAQVIVPACYLRQQNAQLWVHDQAEALACPTAATAVCVTRPATSCAWPSSRRSSRRPERLTFPGLPLEPRDRPRSK